jgi:hypothetical protein
MGVGQRGRKRHESKAFTEEVAQLLGRGNP